jgi:hypothetical protein
MMVLIAMLIVVSPIVVCIFFVFYKLYLHFYEKEETPQRVIPKVIPVIKKPLIIKGENNEDEITAVIAATVAVYFKTT